MAGDWIKLEHATLDKPEVWQIAMALNITPEEVIGRLSRVWVWADQQSRNGRDISVTDVTVDSVARHAGFAQAMRECGWLNGEQGRLDFPNFDRHNGESAKNRALAAERKRRERDKSHDDVTLLSRSDRDIRHANSVTREEKRREEKRRRKEVKGSSVVNPKAVGRASRGARLPQGFIPPKTWLTFCQEERPDLDAHETYNEFHDYWTAKAGQAATKLDWEATWRNWVRNQRNKTR